MLKTIAATALAAYIAYDVTVAPGQNEISSGPQNSLSDRSLLDPTGPGCAQVAWPNYDSKCVLSRTQPSDPPSLTRQVRIVAIERQPAKHQPAKQPATPSAKQ
jgi:hypothetical protein